MGRALTGSESPSPAIIMAVTSLTKSGAQAETTGGISMVLLTVSGTSTLCRWATAASTAAKFRRTTSLAAFAVGLAEWLP